MEAIGVSLSVLCLNIRLHALFNHDHSHEKGNALVNGKLGGNWDQLLQERASELVVPIQNANPSDNLENVADANSLSESHNSSSDDVQWMETETSNKDLSTLAKAAFELLKWRIFSGVHLQKAISVILFSADDPNWRTRSATPTFLRSFMYRHTFILSDTEKYKIWETVERLLTDNQVEVREHAAAVLAGLMKGEDGD